MDHILMHGAAGCALLLAASVQAQDTIDLDEFEDAEETAPISAITAALNEPGSVFAKNMIANVASERFKFLDLAYVKPDAENNNDGWSAKYNWQYQSNSGGGFSEDGGAATLKDIAFEVDIAGTYSYGSADNTEDYSTAKLAFSYLQGNFGDINAITREASVQFEDCLDEANAIEDNNMMLAAEDQCWITHRIDEIVADPGSTYVLSIGGTAGLEGDQNYDSQQSTYGIRGIYSRGNFPSLRLDYEKVDAAKNEERMALTDKETYDRFSAELGYRYQLIKNQGAGTWLYLSYQYFEEMSAPASIKQAGLDKFDFMSASIRFPATVLGFVDTDQINLFIRYTKGQLPFDRQSDSAVQLGFSTNIETLAGLLAQ